MDTWNQNLSTDVYDISNSTFSQTESIPRRRDTGAAVYHTQRMSVTSRCPTLREWIPLLKCFAILGLVMVLRLNLFAGQVYIGLNRSTMKNNEGQFWNCLHFHSFYIHLSLNLQTYRGLILVYDFYLFKRLHRFKILAQVCPLGSYLILLGFKTFMCIIPIHVYNTFLKVPKFNKLIYERYLDQGLVFSK